MAGLEAWAWKDGAHGLRYAGARSTTWDTALAVQARLAARHLLPGAAPGLRRAHRRLLAMQATDDLPDGSDSGRQSILGGWCFSDGAHRWPVSDCTAEALSAVLLCEAAPGLVPTAFDAVVAGGVAGSVAAAALAAEGPTVLMVEPGQQQERRLAGELIHPAGLRGLKAFGFDLHGPAQEGASIRGFAVFHDRDAAAAPNLLPYGDGVQPSQALALEHGTLRACLGAQAAAMPGVTAMEDTRVAGLGHGNADPAVTLRHRDRDRKVRTHLVVAADGASSQVRTLAGIGHRRRRLSTIVGFVVDRDALPVPCNQPI